MTSFCSLGGAGDIEKRSMGSVKVSLKETPSGATATQMRKRCTRDNDKTKLNLGQMGTLAALRNCLQDSGEGSQARSPVDGKSGAFKSPEATTSQPEGHGEVEDRLFKKGYR